MVTGAGHRYGSGLGQGAGPGRIRSGSPLSVTCLPHRRRWRQEVLVLVVEVEVEGGKLLCELPVADTTTHGRLQRKLPEMFPPPPLPFFFFFFSPKLAAVRCVRSEQGKTSFLFSFISFFSHQLKPHRLTDFRFP